MRRSLLLSAVTLALAGCATTSSSYRWGNTEDPEWSPRVGQVTLAEVTRTLGQPMEKLPLPSGDMKVRWFGKPIDVTQQEGSMEDYSVRNTETRAYWRDMRFDATGRLTRAWLSDQRELVDSEGP
jgi:hypothetical protein